MSPSAVATFHGTLKRPIPNDSPSSFVWSASKVCGVRRLLSVQTPWSLCRYPSPAPQTTLPSSGLRVRPSLSSRYGRTISAVYFMTSHGRG